jgi:hypothetical protein
MIQVLERLNNFSSLLALIAGLNNASVSRLKFTFGELSKKKIEVSEIGEKCTSLCVCIDLRLCGFVFVLYNKLIDQSNDRYSFWERFRL